MVMAVDRARLRVYAAPLPEICIVDVLVHYVHFCSYSSGVYGRGTRPSASSMHSRTAARDWVLYEQLRKSGRQVSRWAEALR